MFCRIFRASVRSHLHQSPDIQYVAGLQ
jgi:hypothetical protein